MIDDSAEKVRHVVQVLKARCTVNDDDFTHAANLAEARKELGSTRFDLIVLDLAIPPAISSAPTSNAGIDFLRELHESERLKKPQQVVGLTAYADLYRDHSVIFDTFTWTLLHYSPDQTHWEERLAGKVNYVAALQAQKSDTPRTFDRDFAIVTALHSPELLAVLNLTVDWKLRLREFDYTEYFDGFVMSGNGPRSIVAASAYQMGMCATALLTAKLCLHYAPRFIIMCGIAAGVKGKVNLGDILIAESSWDYGSGKVVANRSQKSFQPDPRYIPIEPSVHQIISRIVAAKRFVDEIQSRWKGRPATDRLQAHLGPIASGASVVQSKAVVQEIIRGNRKLIGLEMETYGTYFSARNWLEPAPRFLSIKSACDFADSEKSDRFHEYAAFTSANYAFELVKNNVLD